AGRIRGRGEGCELHGRLDAVGAVAERTVFHAGGVARHARQAQAGAPAEPRARIAVDVEANAVAVEIRSDFDSLLPRKVPADQVAHLLIATREADALVRLEARPQHHRGVV